ncbi:MAG: WD40 repeat domain-containing protein [Planctomycetaceae bacterium]
MTASYGEVFVRDSDTGAVKFQIDGLNGTATICLSDDGQLIAYGDYENRVVVWHVGMRKQATVLTGHTAPVRQMTFMRNGNRIVTGSEDATVCIWDIETGKAVYKLRGHVKPITQITLCGDENTLLTIAGNEGRIWNLQQQSDVEFSELSIQPDPGFDIEWNGSKFGNLHVQPIGDGFGFGYPSGVGPESHPQKIALSKDGGVAAIVFRDGTIVLWDCRTGQSRAVLDNKQMSDNDYSSIRMTFNPDGGRILIRFPGESDASVWDSTTGAKLFSISHSSVSAAEFSPDGHRIATGSYADGRLRIWNSITGGLMRELPGPQNVSSLVQTSRISFDENGRFVAVATIDHSILLWDLAQKFPPLVLKGHTDEISSLAFNHDGSRLSSGSKDHTARIWDTFSGAETFKALEPSDTTHGILVRFDQDGKRFLTSKDGVKFKVYDSNPISLTILRKRD